MDEPGAQDWEKSQILMGKYRKEGPSVIRKKDEKNGLGEV